MKEVTTFLHEDAILEHWHLICEHFDPNTTFR
jgi:hypothetical protein